MPAKTHTLHGRDHLPWGADPIPDIPGAGSYTDWANALTGVWAYWPLQEASGDAIDQGPTNADCDPVGSPAYRVTGPNDSDLQYAVRLTSGEATSITGDSFYNTADELNMDGQTDLTAMCWIKPDSGSDLADPLPVIGTWDVYRTGWILYLTQTTRQLTWAAGNGSSSDFLLGPVIPDDEWTLVAATRSTDTGLVKLYVNGSEVASDTAGPFAGAPTGHGIRLGAVNFDTTDPDSYHFYGDMAGAVFVDHALTGGEMLDAYNAATGVTTDPYPPRRLLAQLQGPLPASPETSGMYRVPYWAGAAVEYTLERASLWLGDDGSTSTTVEIERSTTTDVFTAETVATLTCASSSHLDEETTGLGTIESGQLLRFNFTAIGTGADNYHVTLEGTET